MNADTAEQLDTALLQLADNLRAVSGPLLLAVSGGADSMLLLQVAATHAEIASRSTVAVFDHGTGEHAERAVALVKSTAAEYGIPVVTGRSPEPASDEAGWRRQRWHFLREHATRLGATIVTAHTRDDRVETVVQRILRGSGARGLAALEASSAVVRPMRHMRRSDVRLLGESGGVRFVNDPSNEHLRHQRVRIRLELLPALLRVRPRFDEELLGVARRAAEWRAEVEMAVDRLGISEEPGGGVRIASRVLDGYDPQELAVLWPAIAARAGLVLDRRGTLRLAGFTKIAKISRIPLSGGWEAVRLRDDWVVRRVVLPGSTEPVVLRSRVALGRFTVRASSAAEAAERGLWGAILPESEPLTVRAWLPGDRIRVAGATGPRRVKRFMADARIPAPEREGWPVVLSGEEIVWIPGLCRSSAAGGEPGGPGRAFICERSN